MSSIQKTNKGKEIVVFNDDAKDIRNIAFDKITDEYSWGKYGEFKVIMMNKNGFINASKLCQNGGKLLKHWNENKHAKALEHEIINSVGNPTNSKIKIKIMNGPNHTRGTYVHPKLIPHIASWISPSFAIKVADIVNEYFTKEALYEKDKLLQKKADKIDRLMAKIDEQNKKMDNQNRVHNEKMDNQSEKMNNQSEKMSRLLRRNKKMSNKIDNLNETAHDLYDQNDELLEKIDNISEDKVIKSAKQSNYELFSLMKNAKRPGRMKYYVIRTQKKLYPIAIKNYKRRDPLGKELLKIEFNPNSRNLWIRIKEKLKDKIIVKLNSFGLEEGYTEKKLLNDIKILNEERYE
jgi:hypothetical protein